MAEKIAEAQPTDMTYTAYRNRAEGFHRIDHHLVTFLEESICYLVLFFTKLVDVTISFYEYVSCRKTILPKIENT